MLDNADHAFLTGRHDLRRPYRPSTKYLENQVGIGNLSFRGDNLKLLNSGHTPALTSQPNALVALQKCNARKTTILIRVAKLADAFRGYNVETTC